MSLLTPNQLAALSKSMKLGFETTAVITRIPFEADELGDDAPGAPVTIGTVRGWLSSSPTAEATNDGGVVTANTYRFDVEVGTDIRPRDRLTIGGNVYVVTDTTADETLALCLSCSLRLRE